MRVHVIVKVKSVDKVAMQTLSQN